MVPGPINRRSFLKHAAGLTGVVGSTVPFSTSRGSKRPNFLFLFADDFAFDHIRALGHPEVYTPNLDHLVRQGTCFINCYNQGGWNGAICIASRTMLMTGQFICEAHQMDSRLKEEASAGRMWPQYFSAADYHTFMSGKWHINCNPESVFDTVRNVRPSMPPDIPLQYGRPVSPEDTRFDASDPTLGGFFAGGNHWSEQMVEDALDFLDQAGNADKPFFMYLAFNAPHDPRQAPKEYLERYSLEDIHVPPNFLPEYPDKEMIGCGPDLRDERLAPFPRTEYAIRVHRREYYAAISHLDAQIGRIVEALDKTGQQDSTYLVFTADNGLAVGCHGFMGKQNMYDHSMKVPFILYGPGIPADTRIDALIYLQDVVPTTLALAGIDIPTTIAFRNLLPLLRNEQVALYDFVFGVYMDLQQMVRSNHVKLIYYPRLDRYLLYDVKNDPYEMHSLYGDPGWKEVCDDLKQLLKTCPPIVL